MHPALRNLGLVTALGAAAALTGCVKLKSRTLVMPDGSGKLTMRVGMNAGLAGLAEMGAEGGEAENPFSSLEIGELEENSEGFVAFGEARESEKDGWKYFEFDAYFEDISKVRMFDTDDETGEKTVQLAYVVSRDGENWALEMTNSMLGEIASKSNEGEDQDEEVPPEMEEMMKGMMRSMLKGFEVSFSVEMPGAVAEVEGFQTKSGNSATVAIGIEDMIDKEKMKEFGAIEKYRITCGAPNVTADALAAWKKELAAAKVSWAQRKATEKAETGSGAGSESVR